MRMNVLIEQLTVSVKQPTLQKTIVRAAQQIAQQSEEVQPVMRVSIPTMPVNLALKSYNAVQDRFTEEDCGTSGSRG